MNEPPGARLRVVSPASRSPSTSAIKRTPTCSSSSTTFSASTQARFLSVRFLVRVPAPGYQPTLATEMGELQERITSTRRIEHPRCRPICMLGRRHHRSSTCHGVCPPRRHRRVVACHHGAWDLSCCRSTRARRRGIPRCPVHRGTPLATRRRQRSAAYSVSGMGSCSTSSRFSVWTKLSARRQARRRPGAPHSALQCSQQPFMTVAEQFTGIKGKYVKLEETISSFERLVAGEFDRCIRMQCVLHGWQVSTTLSRTPTVGEGVRRSAPRLRHLPGEGRLRRRGRLSRRPRLRRAALVFSRGHAAMMTLLAKGELKLGPDVGGRRFQVEDGFLQVADNQVRVVTEHATAARHGTM